VRQAREEERPWEPRLAVALAAIAVAALWLRPLTSSLWLDETGTIWLTDGSLAESLERTLTYQGGSPLYYVFAWSARQISSSEVVLRIPSVLAMGAAVYLLYRLGARLFDRHTGMFAAVPFAALPAVAFAAGDARPYALALVTLLGSAVALLRWQDEGLLRDGLLYALCVVATCYLHYMIALALLAHPVLLARDLGNVPRRQLVMAAGVALALALPLAPNALHVIGQRGVLSNPKPEDLATLVSALAPPLILGAIALPAIVATFARRRDVVVPRPPASSLLFVLTWLIAPFVVLAAVAAFTSTDALITRYLLSTAPAVCLLVGMALAIVPQVAARYVAVGLGVIAALAFTSSDHTTEDWRAAAAAERAVADEETPVLLFSGFIEAKQEDWLVDPERASYLEAPASAYPLDGRVFAGPWELGRPENTYMEDLYERHLRESERVVLMTTGGSSATAMWLDRRLLPDGYTKDLVEVWDDKIFLFTYDR
jgi:mannosyltransferase